MCDCYRCKFNDENKKKCEETRRIRTLKKLKDKENRLLQIKKREELIKSLKEEINLLREKNDILQHYLDDYINNKPDGVLKCQWCSNKDLTKLSESPNLTYDCKCGGVTKINWF